MRIPLLALRHDRIVRGRVRRAAVGASAFEQTKDAMKSDICSSGDRVELTSALMGADEE